ncbi:hypothetical protein BaRGS_00029548 [Batillaria attramentaria]|uniref:Actin n=1 Tax=Batillaria attramentaria TaxID=370345 RepID=A0ABD0JWY5_9CAEN
MDSDEDEVCGVVIDNGTGKIKAGFAGDDAPRVVFPTLTGRARREIVMSGVDTKDHYIGDEAESKRSLLSLHHPMQRGVVTDWDEMELVWHHLYDNELRVPPEQHPVVVTEATQTPKSNREKMTEVFFEQFNVPGFYVTNPGILSTYASGRGTVITVDVGEGQTQVMNIYEGYTNPEAIESMNLGGADLTEALQKLLRQRAYNVGDPSDAITVRDIKEKLCYVALDFEKELRDAECGLTTDEKYELPDGQVVNLSTERFTVPEILFQPSLIGKQMKGLHTLVFDCLQKCPIDTRRDFYCNIFLVGGSTMFPGMAERMQKEIQALVPPAAKVKVIAPPERKLSVWIGGSILASLSTFQSWWITREEYDESGPSIRATVMMSHKKEDESNDDEEDHVIVLDLGSGLIKVGTATDDAPLVVAPVGLSRYMNGPFFGDEISERILRCSYHDLRAYPVKQRGQIVRGRLDDLEVVLHKVFHETLKMEPSNTVVLVDAPLSPKSDTEEIIQMLLDTFSTPAVLLVNEAVLSLYATGRTTGVVVDVGDGVTDVVVIQDGSVLHDASERLSLAGCDVTDCLLRHLRESDQIVCDLPLTSEDCRCAADLANYRNTNRDTVERGIAKTIREKVCYVALNFAQELSRSSVAAERFELPDRRAIDIGNARFLAPEVLFQPHLMNRSDLPGLHEVVNRCIQRCDLDLQSELYRNVILTGGTSVCPGFEDRMRQELAALAPDTFKVKVTAPLGRECMGWRAGATFEQCLRGDVYYGDMSSPSCVGDVIGRDKMEYAGILLSTWDKSMTYL